MTKNKEDYERDYTHPRLRERLKEELKSSDKGGAAGQWSARKSQLLTQEYEKHGGGYRHPRQPTAAQRDLAEWTEQRWETESGSARARHGGTTERYLPARAWEELSPSERRETQQAKRTQSRQGKQRSANPPTARAARKFAELDALPAREAAKRAHKLSPREAAEASRHEREHKARKTVLRQLDKAGHADEPAGRRPAMTEDERDLIADFERLVNMTPKQLERWLATDESKTAGQSDSGGETKGHQSGRRIVALLKKKRSDYTDDDLAHMRRVRAYVKRHLAQPPAGDPTRTTWRYSLMNWGHDPSR